MAFNPNNANGQATMANSAPVTLASNQSALPITDNSGSITVDAPVGTPAYVRLSDGAAAITTLPVSLATVPSHAVTNAGTFVTQENGALLTSAQLLDDVVTAQATALGTTKTSLVGVSTTTAAPTYTTGTINPLNSNTAGALRVDGSGVTQPVSGTFWQATQPVSGTVTANAGTGTMAVSNTVLSVVGGGTEATAQRVTIANDSTGVLSVDDNGGSLTIDAPVGTPAFVRLSDGAAAITTLPVSLASVPSHAVTNAGTFAVQAASAGDVANDGADSGNPIKVGGVATVTEQTAVSASGDRVNASFTSTGKQIVAPFSSPEYFVSGAITTAMTGTTSTSLLAAPGAGLRNYITTIIVSNAHATVGTDVAIQDGSGGTTLMTIPAAAVYGGAVINLPIPLRQPTANTALYCANVTTGASTKVSAVGYKGI